MNNSVLTPEQLHDFRQLLQARREQLLQELDVVQRETLDTATATSKGLADPAGSPRDQANKMASSMVREAEAARDHAELVQVREALERLEEGSYGECTDCGQSVALARLQAQPQAGRCITCQTQVEQAAKR